MYEKFFSRKLVVTVYSLVVGPVLLWFGKLDGPSCVALLLGSSAAYLGSQGLVDHAEARRP